MIKRSSLLVVAFILSLAAVAGAAQNTNTSPTQRGRRSAQAQPTPTPDALPSEVQTRTGESTTRGIVPAPPAQAAPARAASPTERAVRDAFDTLVDGIRRADVETVMGVYWNSPQLTLFNNNGTVTKSWQQVRANRQSSYPNLKDVKLDVRDVRVHVLGPDSAFVSCLWMQTQTVLDRSETASGRLTLVFQKIGGAWKIVHTHTSPDRPDPSLIPPSERTDETPPAATPTPTRPPARP
jgi:uncharacterized protein (TIGR02246 family)